MPGSIESADREIVRTPDGELVSLPRVRRGSWIATIVVVIALLVLVLVFLLTHQPTGASNGPQPAQPTPVGSFS